MSVEEPRRVAGNRQAVDGVLSALASSKEVVLRKALLLTIASVSLGLPASAAHASCYGVSDPIAPITPPGHICGTVNRLRYAGYYYPQTASISYVKICPAGTSSSSFSCSTTNTSAYSDGSGNPVQAFVFRNYRFGATSYADFDLYAWGYYSNDYWGSSTKPIRRISVSGTGLEGISMNMPPRPLDPTPLYPIGVNVPDHYTVRWRSGIDRDRSPYPANYEVWFKYWPDGGAEPANWTLSAANMPCHQNGSGPDANSECSTYVVGPQPPGNWRWYVVANLNVSSVIYFPNTFFTTQSGGVYFFQPQ